MKRLFIALEFIPDNDFRTFHSKACSVFTKLDKVNLVRPDLIHITLNFLGNTEDYKINPLIQGMQDAAKDVPPFILTIGKIGIFGSRDRPRVLWLGASNTKSLQQLHRQLQKELIKIGFKPEHENFVPHLTLARIKKIDDRRFFWNKIELLKQDFVQQLHVDKIILFESILRGHVPIYRKITEVPLFMKEGVS